MARRTDEEGKKRGVSMERSKAGTKKRSPDGLSHPNQNTIIINIIYLDTWSGFEAAKTGPWPSRGLHHFGKFLEPLDERAGRGCCCFLMR